MKKNTVRRIIILLFLVIVACKPEKKYHDEVKLDTTMAQTDAYSDIVAFQKKLNEEFKNPETSPLPDRYRKKFESLDFFAPDTALIVNAKLKLTPNALPFDMPTTTDRKSREVVYGIASFTLNGRQYQLEIYQNKELMGTEGYEDYLFLPFTDKTNGETTYAGGRYMDLRIPDGETLILDFNRAYNPYCAYNKKYSCPLVPSVNALDIAIKAGVKAFRPE